MTINPLLATAPAGRHICQIHRDPQKLAYSVGDFVTAGLKRGERVILVAEPDHTSLVFQYMTWNDWNPDVFQSSGQLTVLDAQATLDQFMRDGSPDWNSFRLTIGGVLTQRSSSQFSGVRVYGEMVNILWKRGESSAAIEVESFWNRLAAEHRFSLFCCYTFDSLDKASYAGPLHELGRTHSDLVQTPDDQRLQAAVDAASREILGTTLSMTLSLSGREEVEGEHRLPPGHAACSGCAGTCPTCSRGFWTARATTTRWGCQRPDEGCCL